MSIATPALDPSTNAAASKSTSSLPLTQTASSDAAAKLAEAIDDFLGDVELKFKHISDEMLTKLDDMAERCDRLEQEMLLRESSAASIDTRSKSTLKSEGAGEKAI